MRSTSMKRRRRRSANRTRTLFYALLAMMLAIIAFSLSAQIIDSAVLRQIYIAAAILSVGVVAIDMLGFLGAHHGDDGGAYDSDGGHHGGDDGGDGYADQAFDDGSFDDGASGDYADGADVDYADGDDAFGHAESSVDEGHDFVVGHGPVLEAIRYLRMFVYFCLGFGLVGLAILSTGRTAQASLLFAGIAGVGSVLFARTFYRLQPGDTGDVISDDDLLLEQGTVLVPLSNRTMGKVRVQVGMQVYEPFARAAQPGQTFDRGDTVKIIEVTDDCVFVEGA